MSEHQHHRSRTGAGTADETATRASSAAPAPAHENEPAHQHEREQPEQVPAGEPEAPVGPTTKPQRDPEEGDDHERKLAQDLEELTVKAQKADEYLELAQRTQADFENYRRRTAREAASAQERGVVKLAKELLPAVDNLDRAMAAAQTESQNGGDGTLADGIKLVHADVIAALARVGIEPYWPQGEPFDPQHHEAVAQQPVEGKEPGTIVEVYQRGYRLGDSVLRPARVVVAG